MVATTPAPSPPSAGAEWRITDADLDWANYRLNLTERIAENADKVRWPILIKWLLSDARKRGVLAFTSGPERIIADCFEVLENDLVSRPEQEQPEAWPTEFAQNMAAVYLDGEQQVQAGTPDDLFPATPPQPAPAAPATSVAVITEPGKYVQRTMCDRAPYFAKVYCETDDGLWLGLNSENTPTLWRRDGSDTRNTGDFDLIGPYTQPPEPVKPVLTIVEVLRKNGWVFAWATYCGGIERGKSRGRLHITLWPVASCGYRPCDGHIAVNPNAPFVCREDQWDEVQSIVAQVNAEAGAAGE